MRTLVVTEFVSLDGVMDSPGGEEGYAHSGWVGDYFTDELGEYKLAEQLAADRAAAWPRHVRVVLRRVAASGRTDGREDQHHGEGGGLEHPRRVGLGEHHGDQR